MKYTIFSMLFVSILMFDLTTCGPIDKRYSVNRVVEELKRYYVNGDCVDVCQRVIVNMWVILCDEACRRFMHNEINSL